MYGLKMRGHKDHEFSFVLIQFQFIEDDPHTNGLFMTFLRNGMLDTGW